MIIRIIFSLFTALLFTTNTFAYFQETDIPAYILNPVKSFVENDSIFFFIPKA